MKASTYKNLSLLLFILFAISARDSFAKFDSTKQSVSVFVGFNLVFLGLIAYLFHKGDKKEKEEESAGEVEKIEDDNKWNN